MAIHLITGLPGHGKGVYSLDTVEKLRIKSNRPVYYHNINNLNLQWHQLDDPKKWIDCPEGSIIVLDEAWQTFPLRPNAQTPPEYVSRLATHRHHGFDIYIITQQPTQLDSFVRKLVDTHYHIVRKFGSQAANVHQFVGLNPDPQKSRRNSIKHDYRYPKHVYQWYKSAEVHTVQTKRPFRIYMLWFGLPLLLAGAIYGVNKVLNPTSGAISEHGQDAIKGKDGTTDNEESSIINPAGYNKEPKLTYIQAHTPEIADFPHTAPIYADITRPAYAPYPAACVIMRNKCQCYTQQGTKLQTPEQTCKQIVENGFFVEWQQQENTIKTTEQANDGVSGRSPDGGLDVPPSSVGLSSRSSPNNAPAT